MQLSKAAVCFFRVKSIVGRYFTTYEDEYVIIIMHMLCSKLPLTVLLEDLNWFAEMSSTALEDHAHNYWYNPYTQECLSVVNLTAHLTTITITSTLHCPKSTVALLHHILHHNLLPCTVTSLNLTHQLNHRPSSLTSSLTQPPAHLLEKNRLLLVPQNTIFSNSSSEKHQKGHFFVQIDIRLSFQ